MSGQQKRPRSSPTFLTPTQPSKRTPRRFLHSRSARRRLRLSFRPDNDDAESVLHEKRPRNETWSRAEITFLIEFIVSHHGTMQWPMHHRTEFWDNAATFVQNRSGCFHQRSGSSCRYKVIKWLKRKFETPKSAEIFYSTRTSIGIQVCSAQGIDVGVQTDELDSLTATTSSGKSSCSVGVQADLVTDLQAVSVDFSKYCKDELNVEVSNDFLQISASAMVRLKAAGRSNVVYNLAKGIGTHRRDSSESLFPVERMPMGLVEYTANFFVSEDINSVPQCPSDYRTWLQTMYCQFGQKWAKLHHGPMWSVASTYHLTHSHERLTMKALVNVPSPAERTIRRDIAASDISLDAAIQVSVLDEAAKAHPNTWWWIKADGADLVSGLGESVRGVWSGDVDLNDGALTKAHEHHQQQLDQISLLGQVSSHSSQHGISRDLVVVEQELINSVTFLSSRLKKATDEYSRKQHEGKAAEKVMFQLAWDVKELGELEERGRKLIVNCSSLKAKIMQDDYDMISDNFPRQLTAIKDRLLLFTKQVMKYKRTPATHILVVMISPEERTRKPYALPVQCLAYVSLGDMAVRRVCDILIKEMDARGMKVAGFATDGEWNSLRSKGYERPLSIFEIRARVRAKYRSLSYSTLVGMITPIRSSDGSLVSLNKNSVVSSDVLKEISSWLAEECEMKDVITRLRQRTVPEGHIVHSWINGKEESEDDKLRSILAQFEYTSKVKQYCIDGIDFDKHLHIPEVHKVTGSVVCQREDEGHLFKRIANSLRQGRVDNVCLERFVEALQDPSTHLTHPALTGVRKQSVQDVERLFGHRVSDFMEREGYTAEAKFLRVVRNWRRAIDERGLDEVQRQEFLQDFKVYICEDLMPWYAEGLTDFSLLEVNRPLDRVRGFTRETLIGVCASIETRQWRYEFNSANQLSPEHPRSSTTDDIECFFSVLRDCVGKNFTLKQVYYEWRKVSLEFSKRMDPTLPFYYHTSTDRFYEGEMPAFNETPKKSAKESRPPRREMLAGNTGRRASFPVRSSLSVRAQFHNVPVNLPPPIQATPAQRVLAEHSYC